ncbi:cellulose synthase [Burkholderia sp. MSMB617WGS]|uniref:UDP-forming cellulose synthase catalytic subunit n=1 Tax=Burkholderia sp. MSMB617WGS TaxID=1637831 RepID=UPI00075FDEA4|nr:UDP-forming cellulose synthase catalytic subunit [Burkholderia sp. MSMB617WGS]AOK46346.1 cellulose synthase [Burkholderia sp. MSMB617WGS]
MTSRVALGRRIGDAAARMRDWIARGLGVPAERSSFDWLVRAFFHPPAPGRRDAARDWLRAAILAVATQWGVMQPHSSREWLWRVVVRAPRPASAVRRRAIERHSARFAPARRVARRAKRRVAVMLGALPWERWSARMERGATRVARSRVTLSIVAAAGAALWLWAATSPLLPGAQFAFFAAVLGLALVIRRMPGHVPTLVLAMLALLSMMRYVWWRSTETLDFRTPVEALVGYLLYAAEAYTWLILVLGFVQTIWPLDRSVEPLPDDPAGWPSVDVYIPTYDEPLAVVKPTIFAAQSLDWPAGKLNVYLLDDGRRPEFEAFARDAGVGYLTRDDNRHAKAGNINSALARTHGEYVAIFDCDHVPTRSFLQTTMGAFLRDPNCALVQTPHHFFSPDPFERNLGTFRRVPNEGSLFYGLVQAGNDLWNAAFFCGSCAVLKRGPLEEVGGVAVETVTEDAHTALKLHRRGYTSAYLPTVQAAGLATESLAGHIKQRIRWARGMAQIFRIDNPFVGRGLGLFQRICYGNAMLHFFYGIPRLVFLTVPIAYLFFHLYFINASALALASYVLPYLVLAQLSNSRMQGRFRHSFWAEVYESVLAWYIALPTTIAFLSPRHGRFNVTAKGGRIDEAYVDWATSKPYLALLALNAGAICAGVVRLVVAQGDEASTVLLTMSWTLYNLMMLGAAIGVAYEAKQVRVTHRIAMRVPATLLFADGTTIATVTHDYSSGGLGLEAPAGLMLEPGTPLRICITRGDQPFHFPVRVARSRDGYLGVQFEQLTLERERQLVECTFGRADAWLDWRDDEPSDAPLSGLVQVATAGIAGYARLARRTLRMVRSPREAERAR